MSYETGVHWTGVFLNVSSTALASTSDPGITSNSFQYCKRMAHCLRDRITRGLPNAQERRRVLQSRRGTKRSEVDSLDPGFEGPERAPREHTKPATEAQDVRSKERLLLQKLNLKPALATLKGTCPSRTSKVTIQRLPALCHQRGSV